MSAREYTARMEIHARRAALATDLPVSLILAQWALESGWGTSRLATQHNNQAGIKYVSESIARGSDGYAFASYRDLSQFTADYIRVLSLSYYDHVRQAGRAGGPPAEVAIALGHSPYDEGHYDDGLPGGKLIATLTENPWLYEYDAPGAPKPVQTAGGGGGPVYLMAVAALVAFLWATQNR